MFFNDGLSQTSGCSGVNCGNALPRRTLSNDNVLTLKNDPPMATVTAAGDVTIDWNQVEIVAARKQEPCVNAQFILCAPGGDMLRSYAILMLAIRDGKWRPAR